jgi:hypothetical protein
MNIPLAGIVIAAVLVLFLALVVGVLYVIGRSVGR